MKYKVRYNGCEMKWFEASDESLDLGQAITDWADAEYNADTYTDGTDVWYTDENGNQVTVMHDMSIEERTEA